MAARIKRGASQACLDALVGELETYGCAVRVDHTSLLLECAVPFGSLAWVLHGGFEGVLRPFERCVWIEGKLPGRPRWKAGRVRWRRRRRGLVVGDGA